MSRLPHTPLPQQVSPGAAETPQLASRSGRISGDVLTPSTSARARHVSTPGVEQEQQPQQAVPGISKAWPAAWHQQLTQILGDMEVCPMVSMHMHASHHLTNMLTHHATCFRAGQGDRACAAASKHRRKRWCCVNAATAQQNHPLPAVSEGPLPTRPVCMPSAVEALL